MPRSRSEEDSDEEDDDDGDDAVPEDGYHSDGTGPAYLPGMPYERTTVSQMRMAATVQQERAKREDHELSEHAASPQRTLAASDRIRQLVRKRYGTCVRGWREAMDASGAHGINQGAFCGVARKLGFEGDLREAWIELSGGRSKMTLADLDPGAARGLSSFYNAFCGDVGPLPALLGQSDSLRANRADFMDRCQPLRKHTGSELAAVFANLQITPGVVTAEDCDWLEHYCERKSATSSAADPGRSQELRSYAEASEMAAQRRLASDFRTYLKHRFGGTIPAWHQAFVGEGDSEITDEDFEAAVEELGYKCNAGDLWASLVGDSDVMTLGDLEPSAREALRQFRARCAERFGSVAGAFRELEAAGKPLVGREEFANFCKEISFAKGRLLFDFLDDARAGRILLDAIDSKAARVACGDEACSAARAKHEGLDRQDPKQKRIPIRRRAAKQCGATKRSLEDAPSCRKGLLRVLDQRFGSPVRGWQTVLDPKGKGKLKRDEFLVSCRAAGYTGSGEALWAELGLKATASVRFRDLAPEAAEECREFRSRCGKSLDKFLAKHEPKKGEAPDGAPISSEAFKEFCKEVGYGGSAERLARHLDPAGEGAVNTRSLRWFEEVRNEDKALPNFMKKHMAHKKQAWRQKLAAQVIAPTREVELKQTRLLEAGRTQRATKLVPGASKEELLRALAKKYGSVARAWRLAMAPEDESEIDAEQFIAGLQTAQMLKADPEESELEKAEQLFELLDAGEKGTISLADLDPATASVFEEFKECCVGRYGGMRQAFEAVDPDGSGELSIEAFRLMCHTILLSHGVHRLVEYLDAKSAGKIQLSTIDEDAAEAAAEAAELRTEAREKKLRIDEMRGRAHMKTSPPPVGVPAGVEARAQERRSEAGEKALAAFKKRLQNKHGTLVRAWRALLNPGGKKRIGPRAFAKAFKEMGVDGDPESAWSALGLTGSTLSLDEFDPGVAGDLHELRARMVERFGSVEHAFEKTDTNGDFQLDIKEFLALCYECQFRRNERRLFEYLDVGSTARIHLSAIDPKAVARVRKQREELQQRRSPPEKKGGDQDGGGAGAGDTDDETGPSTGGDRRSVASPGAPSPELAAFRQLLSRRFGSMVKAWRVIDHEGLNALTKDEFVKNVASTGFTGMPEKLWKALERGEKDMVSLRELNPEVFKRLADFRRRCVRRLKNFRRAFEDDAKQPTARLTREDFCALCKRVRCPKPWEELFQQLDARGSGSITWDDARFLEELWEWDGASGEPVRRERATRAAPAAFGSPPGPLFCSSFRPRMVTLKKSTSLPAIVPALRPNWNDRHQIVDTPANMDSQVVHLVTCVLTQDADKVRQRVAQNIQDVPTREWCEDKLAPTDDEEDEDDDGELRN